MPIFGLPASTGILAGGFALVAGLWSSIKTIVKQFFLLFFVKFDVIKDHGTNALKSFLFNECQPMRFRHLVVYPKYEFIRPRKKSNLVAMEVLPDGTSFWKYKKNFFCVNNKGSDIVSIVGLRFLLNIDSFVFEFVEKFNSIQANILEEGKEIRDRFYVRKLIGTIGNNRGTQAPPVGEKMLEDGDSYRLCNKHNSRPIGWERNELGLFKKESPMDLLSLSDEAVNATEDSIRWFKSEKWFKEKLIPWKRGLLLYGKPGTGKTAFVRALGQTMNVPINVYDMATMSNQDLSRLWDESMSYAPCIMLFEDLDSIFDKRKNIASKGMETGLTFDCFLNVLDGVCDTDGAFIIITTNDISKIDDAIGVPCNGDFMSTRPGRIDHAIEFKELDFEGKMKMAKNILSDFDEKTWINMVKDDGHLFTGAQFQEKCSSLALELFWKNKENSV